MNGQNPTDMVGFLFCMHFFIQIYNYSLVSLSVSLVY